MILKGILIGYSQFDHAVADFLCIELLIPTAAPSNQT